MPLSIKTSCKVSIKILQSSQGPPQIDQNCCYECGDSLDGIFCRQYYFGYNCPPKDPIISKPEPCNQTINEIPQTLPSLDPSCFSLPHVSKPNLVDDPPNDFNLPPHTLPIIHSTFNYENGNSFIYNSKPHSSHDFPNFSYPPPQLQFETYLCELCGNNAHYGYDCSPQFPFEIDEEYERDCEIRIRKLKQDFNEWGSEVQKKEQAYEEEKYSASCRYMLSVTCDDEDDSIPLGDIIARYSTSKAITPDLPIEESENSLIMGDEPLSTIPATESDEVIKSSVENLVPIPSEFEGIFDDTCDVPVGEDSSTFDALSDHSEILSDSNDDGTSSDDDDFEDIKYVSLEEVNDVDQEEKEFDLEDILQIQYVILREKLLNINRLIVNIESLNDNPSPDRVFKSPSSVPIPVTDSDSFFEESDTSLSYSDNPLPEFEPFSDDTEETRSGSTTTHANHSLPEYDSFLFEIEPDQGELTNIVIEEVDIFLVSEDSIPPGIESSFDPGGGEINVSHNVEDDNYFTFVIRTFLLFLTYPKDFPLLLFTGSEDTIFDPGIFT
ncbi:hypothetical protein Tco_0690159 [Tanacetum coccineum]